MKTETTGISIFSLLTIVFVVLKLCGVIAWSWWLVLLPALISIALTIISIIILFLLSE